MITIQFSDEELKSPKLARCVKNLIDRKSHDWEELVVREIEQDISDGDLHLVIYRLTGTYSDEGKVVVCSMEFRERGYYGNAAVQALDGWRPEMATCARANDRAEAISVLFPMFDRFELEFRSRFIEKLAFPAPVKRI